MEIGNAINGWYNVIRNELGILPEKIKLIAEKRLKICEPCPRRKDSTCTLCGCPLQSKSKSVNATCPLDKWPIER